MNLLGAGYAKKYELLEVLIYKKGDFMKKVLVVALLLVLAQSYVLAGKYVLIITKNGTNHIKHKTEDVSRNSSGKRYTLICVDGSKFYTNYRNNYVQDDHNVFWKNGGRVCHIRTRNNL